MSDTPLAGYVQGCCPLVEPGPEPGTVIATFWWQEPAEEHRRPDWVYVDITGISDRAWFDDTLMHRLDGTPLWWLSLILPDQWRGSYGFSPGRGPTRPVDPERQWWADLYGRIEPDPWNPSARFRSLRRGLYSEAAMPAAPPQRWVPPGDTIVHTVSPDHFRLAVNGVERSVWVADHGEGDAPRALVLALDGQTWINEAPIAGGLLRLSADSSLRPFVVVFVDSIDSVNRSRDFTCSPTFRASVIDGLVPWVEDRYPIEVDPRLRIVAGQSLGGLAALDLTLTHPQVFGSSIAQSAALWWPAADWGGGGRWTWPDRLAAPQVTDLRFWLQTGSLEADMAALTRQFADDALAAGADVTLDEFCGGHDVVHWRNGLIEGLSSLLRLPEDGDLSLGAPQTQPER